MKKKLLTLLVTVFCTINAFAECSDLSFQVWPKTTIINQNSIFIFECYGSAQKIINGLNSQYKIYLKGNNATIDLQVLKSYKSNFNLTQVILKPKIKLIEGETYTLYVDGLEDYEKGYFYTKSYSWRVNNKTDVEKPIWRETPKYFSKHKIAYGCGPASFVDFCFCTKDNSSVVIFTKLKELKTGKISEYFLIPDSSFVRVGKDMCAGEFVFQDGEDYEVSFSLMDASGNVNNTLTKPVKFISPTNKDDGDESEKPNCNCPNEEILVVNNQLIYALPITIAATLLLIVLLVIYLRKKRLSK